MAETFARAGNDLLAGPQIGVLAVAAQPTAGQGFALPLNGTQPLMLAAQGARKAAFGTAVLHWSTSTISDTLTVTHGLGATPVCVILTPKDGVGPALACTAQSSTTFSVQGTNASALTGNTNLYWLAIA